MLFPMTAMLRVRYDGPEYVSIQQYLFARNEEFVVVHLSSLSGVVLQ